MTVHRTTKKHAEMGKKRHISLSHIDRHTGNGVEQINDSKPRDLQSRLWGNGDGGR